MNAKNNVPMRKCIACKTSFPKKELLRIVRDKSGGVTFDKTHTLEGRGAYVCNSDACIQKCVKNKLLNRAFKTNIEIGVYESVFDGERRKN